MGDPGDRSAATVTSPIHETPFPFDTLVPSWSATEDARVGIEVRIRSTKDSPVDQPGAWSGWLDLGVWAGDATRHSAYTEADDPDWAVDTDTVVSRGGARADAYRYRLTLATDPMPVVKSFCVVVSDSARHGYPRAIVPLTSVWDAELPVPTRSQMAYGRGEEWCSPTSLSMTLAYWAGVTGEVGWDPGIPEVARGVYDSSYGGWGNWPFNTAYASQLGLEAAVGRLGSVEETERWLAAGVPLVASVAWDNGVSGQELAGAPIARSDGHLLVIRGFTGDGDVVVNDPAAPVDAGVRRVYGRDEFSRAWLANPGSSGGIVYLVHPPGCSTPF